MAVEPEPAATTSEQPEPAGTSSRQRSLILAAAALGLVLAVAFGLVSVANGRSPLAVDASAPASMPAAAGAALVPPATGQTAGGPAAGGQDDAPVVAALTAKDPFRPVVSSVGEGGAGSGGTQAPATGSTVPGAAAGTATPSGGGTTTTRKFTLLDVFVRSGVRYAKVQVGSTTHQVKEGQTFAGSYEAVDIGTSCAEFLAGSTAFTLCEGEAVLK